MALKLNMAAFGNKEDIVNEIPKSVPVVESEEIQEEAPVDFAMGNEIEKEEVKEEPQIEKKTFEGHNKEVLSKAEENMEFLPNIPIAVKDDEEISQEEVEEKIIERAEKRVESFIDEEIQNEVAHEINNRPDVNAIKVLCVGGNEQYFKTTLSHLHEEFPDVNFIRYVPVGGKSALYTIDSLQPDILLVYHKTQIQTALQFYESLQNDKDENGIPYREKYKNKRIVVIAPNDLKYEIDMRNKGLQFFIKENNPKTHTLNIPDLIEVIRAAARDISMAKEEREIDSMVEITDIPEISTKEKLPIVPSQQAPTDVPQKRYLEVSQSTQELPENKIICVYSASGGSGKTMFATNIASILSKYSNQAGAPNYRVALVEYNLVCRNLDIFFNIKTNKDVGGLAQEVAGYTNANGEINIEPERLAPLISQYMYKEPNSGLDILLGISVPLEIDRIGKGFSKCLFQTLRNMYDVVIVDMATDIAKAPVLDAFSLADEIYYIMPMDVASIRNARRLIRFFTGLFKFKPEQVKIIINKANPDNEEYGIDQIYDALKNDDCVPEGTIPYMDKEVLSSINRGIPLGLEALDNPVSQSIYSIALGINPMLSNGEVTLAPEKPEKKGLMGGLFGGNKKKKKDVKKPKIKMPKAQEESNELPMPVQEVQETLPARVEERKRPKRTIFGNKKKKEEVSSSENGEEKKLGFFARLFGGFGKKKEKKETSIKIQNKKAPPKLGALPMRRPRKD